MTDNDHAQVTQQQQGSQPALPDKTGERLTPDGTSTSNVENGANDKLRRSQKADTQARKSPTASSRKTEANRRNALKSTGPRTPIGKKTVARNAIKHGFFSKWLTIQHPDGKENQDEFDDWYGAFREDYQPVGFVEELWVERIAVLSWRLRRLIRCESGQTALALAEHSYDLKHPIFAVESRGVRAAEAKICAFVSCLREDALTAILDRRGKSPILRNGRDLQNAS